MNNGVSVLIAAYNEAENLKLLLPKLNISLKNLPCEYEILVVETTTPLDNTKEICDEYNVICISRIGGNTYGDAIKTGINKAKYSKTVVIDADCSHSPDDIIRLYNKMQEGYDVCIGSRYIKGGKNNNSFISVLMSHCVNLAFSTIYNFNIKDLSNSFRMYDSDKLKNIELHCKNYDVVEEILIKLRYNIPNIKIAEIPISFKQRENGKSKRKLLLFIMSYLKTLLKLLKYRTKGN